MRSSLGLFMVISCAVLLMSCEKELILKDQDVQDKLVVTCLLDNDRDVKVYLTKNMALGESSSLNCIPDARVELYEDGTLLQVMPFVIADTGIGFGYYTINYHPIQDRKYGVKVIHAQYDTVSATDLLPVVPVVTMHEWVQKGDKGNRFRNKYKIRLDEDGGRANYYRVNVFRKGVKYNLTSIKDTVFSNYDASCGTFVTTALKDTVRDYSFFLFGDDGINGSSTELNLEFEAPELLSTKTETLCISLYAVSKAHYEYYRTLEQYRGTKDFIEPVKVYNNITNGYGSFNSQCGYKIEIPIK